MTDKVGKFTRPILRSWVTIELLEHIKRVTRKFPHAPRMNSICESYINTGIERLEECEDHGAMWEYMQSLELRADPESKHRALTLTVSEQTKERLETIIPKLPLLETTSSAVSLFLWIGMNVITGKIRKLEQKAQK